MYSLCLDSSANCLSVGFCSSSEVICEVAYEAWQAQSEHMVPEIANLMEKYHIQKEQISDVIVSIGPGSYTGVRIALTIAKIVSLALNIPIYPVSSLRVLKKDNLASICLINARSGRSYFGVYKGNEVLVKDTIYTNEEVKKYIQEHPDYIVCGDARYLGLDISKSEITKQMMLLKNSLEKLDDNLGLKPIYMKD